MTWRNFLCKIGLHKKEDDHNEDRFPNGLKGNDMAIMMYVMKVGVPWKCKACSKLGWR
jgi:hypothetical protein